MNTSFASLGTLAKLRPPFARSALLLFPYSNDAFARAGITVETVAGESAIAAGTGTVSKVYSEPPQWQTSDSILQRTTVKHVVIDHGNKVSTVVGGLSTVSVNQGQTVYRGDKLGDLFTTQLFFAAIFNTKSVNPLTLNQHWLMQNNNVVTGQGGRIRFAPDRLLRDLSDGVTVILNAGVHYFKQAVAPTPLLVNVAFNGDGSKTGTAATGFSDTDYWNVYVPVDFTATADAACYSSGYSFSTAPVLLLNDYTNTRSPIILERIAPLFSAASGTASWDNLFKLWIGGYVGPVPYENTFRIRNLPAGDFDLFLYANEGTFPTASAFYVSVNAGLPAVQNNNPSITPGFVEGVNYVKYSLSVPASSYITVKAVGYLSGLQLERV